MRERLRLGAVMGIGIANLALRNGNLEQFSRSPRCADAKRIRKIAFDPFVAGPKEEGHAVADRFIAAFVVPESWTLLPRSSVCCAIRRHSVACRRNSSVGFIIGIPRFRRGAHASRNHSRPQFLQGTP